MDIFVSVAISVFDIQPYVFFWKDPKRQMVCMFLHVCVHVCVTRSVIHSDIAEQVGHGLSVVDAADGLRQDHADVDCFNLWTLELLEFVGDRVGHHHLGGDKKKKGWEGNQVEVKFDTAGKISKSNTHLIDGRLLYEPGGITGEDAVCGHNEDLVGPSFLQRLGCCHETVNIIDDVILMGETELISSHLQAFKSRMAPSSEDILSVVT